MKNDFAEDLQRQIDKDLRKIYSAKVIDYWKNPRNWGIMNNASGYGKVTGPCGDTMEISIKVGNNRIVKCTYDTDGCGASIVCGSLVTEMVIGKTVKEARQITQDKVLQFCGGLPEEDKHCVLLAANTLHKAIDDYEMLKNDPWKKLYRRM
jgi:nitrogen fixation NifU-like protein